MTPITKTLITFGIALSVISAIFQRTNLTAAYADEIHVIKEDHIIAAQPINWTPTLAKTYVKARAEQEGWTGKEWRCLYTIVWRESRFEITADNEFSTAYGLFQVLHTPRDTPIEDQVDGGFKYLKHRYDGAPCVAKAHHDRHGWW